VKQSIPQPLVIVLIVVGFLIAAAGGYFLVLGPQRSQASSLDKQIADTQSSIDSARALTLQAKEGAKIRVADIFRLTKAMPDQTDMADIVLELNKVAEDSGITFEQITP
jgi:Tfp pilus assembly protein PilO